MIECPSCHEQVSPYQEFEPDMTTKHRCPSCYSIIPEAMIAAAKQKPETGAPDKPQAEELPLGPTETPEAGDSPAMSTTAEDFLAGLSPAIPEPPAGPVKVTGTISAIDLLSMTRARLRHLRSETRILEAMIKAAESLCV